MALSIWKLSHSGVHELSTSILTWYFLLKVSFRIQVAILDSAHQLFLKCISYPSTNIGIRRGKSIWLLAIRNLSSIWEGRTNTCKWIREDNGVWFVPKVSGSFYCGDIRKERGLYELKQPKETFLKSIWGEFKWIKWIEYHQSRNMGKSVLCGKERLIKDSDLRLLEVCRWSVCISTVVEKA